MFAGGRDYGSCLFVAAGCTFSVLASCFSAGRGFVYFCGVGVLTGGRNHNGSLFIVTSAAFHMFASICSTGRIFLNDDCQIMSKSRNALAASHIAAKFADFRPASLRRTGRFRCRLPYIFMLAGRIYLLNADVLTAFCFYDQIVGYSCFQLIASSIFTDFRLCFAIFLNSAQKVAYFSPFICNTGLVNSICSNRKAECFCRSLIRKLYILLSFTRKHRNFCFGKHRDIFFHIISSCLKTDSASLAGDHICSCLNPIFTIPGVGLYFCCSVRIGEFQFCAFQIRIAHIRYRIHIRKFTFQFDIYDCFLSYIGCFYGDCAGGVSCVGYCNQICFSLLHLITTIGITREESNTILFCFNRREQISICFCSEFVETIFCRYKAENFHLFCFICLSNRNLLGTSYCKSFYLIRIHKN